MSTPLGVAMLAVTALLIWLGLPNRNGVHHRFLRFSTAQIFYPPVVLVVALGSPAIINSIHF